MPRTKHHRSRRWTRRIRHWWRETPTRDIAQTAFAIAVVIVVAGLIAYRFR